MPIKQITIEESTSYVPFDKDFENNDPQYFTISPSTDPNYPGEQGWEDVRYFTKEDKSVYSNRDGEGDSWVYVLSNPSIPGQLKIGSTSKSPEERAAQISRGSGVPTDFKVEFAFWCFNALACEREIHKLLKDSRVSKQREFFIVTLHEATEAVKEIGKRYV
jgi:hypothetical protein